jgi:hypothetical protein
MWKRCQWNLCESMMILWLSFVHIIAHHGLFLYDGHITFHCNFWNLLATKNFVAYVHQPYFLKDGHSSPSTNIWRLLHSRNLTICCWHQCWITLFLDLEVSSSSVISEVFLEVSEFVSILGFLEAKSVMKSILLCHWLDA